MDSIKSIGYLSDCFQFFWGKQRLQEDNFEGIIWLFGVERELDLSDDKSSIKQLLPI